MLNVSPEEIAERWDSLPDKLREALFSEENSDLIDQLGTTYSLSTETLDKIIIGTSNVLHGFMHPEDLRTELSSITGVNSDVIVKICSDIKTKIFDPLEPELGSIYQPPAGISDKQNIVTKPGRLDSTTTPQQMPETTNTTIPTQAPVKTADQSIQQPSETIVNAAQETPTEAVVPFMLHRNEEEGSEPVIRGVITPSSPVRPMFYKAPSSTPTTETNPLSSRPIKARLELGAQEEKEAKGPSISRTKPTGTQRVNYSDFRTKLDDPFASQIKIEDGKSPDKNVGNEHKKADLKDLPL